MENKINWYPGHMKKATDRIIEVLPSIDLVIEVIDARCIKTSSNKDLISILKNKNIVRIALKKDLSDIDEKQHPDILFISTKNKNDRNVIINHLYKVFDEKIKKLRQKGLVNPQFTILVAGLPNVGKSTLINFLSKKNTLIVANKAGVTKKQVNKVINDNFLLVDNPGIFVKNILHKVDGYKLSLINSISKNVIPISEINNFYHSFMLEKYWSQYSKFFEISEKISYDKFVEFIGNKLNFKLRDNEIDIDKVDEYLFNIYCNAKVCRYHFE